MKKIDFKSIIRHHDLQFAKRIYPSIQFCNNVAEDENICKLTEAYLREILDVCKSDAWDEDTLFTTDVVFKFAAQLPEVFLQDIDVEDVVGFWLSYYMGNICSGIEDPELTYRLLVHMFYSYDGRGFVYSYVPSPDVIKVVVNKVDYSTEHLLRRCRIVQDEESIKEYIHFYTNQSEIDLIKDICRDSFYADFHPLPDDCLVLALQMIKSGLYKEWMERFSNIIVPFLKAEMFQSLQDAETVISLFECLVDDESSNSKASRIMLMNEWFHLLVREQSLYMSPLQIDMYDYEMMEMFAENHKTSDERVKQLVYEGLKSFINHVGCAEVSEWLFGKSMKANDGFASNGAHNLILRYTQEYVANVSSIDSYNLKAKDLHYLSFVAKQFAEQGIDDERRNVLLESIWSFIESEDFYWSSALEPQTLDDLRSIAKCISIKYDDKLVSSIMRRFRVLYEGINACYMNQWYKKADRECYVFCVLLFMLECDIIDKETKKEIFKHISSSLLKQVNCCGMDLIVEHNYRMPLIVAEVMTDQIVTECKDDFEYNLAKAVYEKNVVMVVLSFAKSPISSDAKTIIKNYRDGDWLTIRQDHLRRKRKNEVQDTENLFAKLL